MINDYVIGVGDLVQFTENHKWCGCIGIVEELKDCNGDTRYLIGVPIPQGGTAYIFSMQSEDDIEYCGRALLMPAKEKD